MMRRDELEAARRASTAQLLFQCARLVNERALERVRERSGRDVRAAHTALFPHIDLEGTRLTELARRLGVSKQAVAQLVTELEDMGVLERVADPRDGRAKLIRWSARGRAAIAHGLGVLREIEDEIAAAIGSRHARNLRAALLALGDYLEG